MTTKVCIDCKKRKPLEAFYRVYKNVPEVRQARCKPCDNLKRVGNVERHADEVVDALRRDDGSIALVRRPRRVARRWP